MFKSHGTAVTYITYWFHIWLFIFYHLVGPFHQTKSIWRYTSTRILLMYQHKYPT